MDNYFDDESGFSIMENRLKGEDIIIRGNQRQSVYDALTVPRTGKQILEQCRQLAPTMSYQDLRHILRDFQSDGLVICLNPESLTGRFYIRSFYAENFELSAAELHLCCLVNRGRIRQVMLREIGTERLDVSKPLTVTFLRKQLLDTYPLSLNHALGGVQFLQRHGLIRVVDTTRKRDLKVYAITESGKRVLHFLFPETQVHEITPTRIPCNGT